ncbi:hypothetical protein [Alkalimonas mucilaginosa]|uniref:Uncharacterized protein n=1 Tax=Alkalimonas mucilaginosa TaxID=3057676 RepID=A0ABU7JH88_9GAMM|nr:hypothetical protein [Alkalimonas sp. MEB004]MEE2025020.1 hypothetical protein [Alkalimonas sp. MEB004]
MDNLTAFILNSLWIIAFILAMFYNMARRPDLKAVTILAGLLAAGYAITHWVTAELFDGRSYHEHITFQYILWGGACLAIIALILSIRPVQQLRLYWVHWTVILLLAIDVLGNILMHLDQNIVGLNTLAEPNLNWSTDSWWLWYWYSAQSNINNALILALLFVPVGMESKLMSQPKNIKKLFKSLIQGFNILTFLNSQQSVMNRMDVIQDMIDALPHAERSEAQSLLFSAKELTYRMDETGQEHYEAITLLLDAAAHCASHISAHDANTALLITKAKSR